MKIFLVFNDLNLITFELNIHHKMFSKGQLIFAACFFVAFVLLMIWSYRKDIKIHKKHYKNTFLILISLFLIIAIFAMITFSLY